MKVAIVGTRGIPANYGGFETFAQEVSVELLKHNVNITVYCDKNDEKELTNYNGVRLRYLNTTKGRNPIYYYLQSVYYGLKENDIIIVTGTGGAIFYILNYKFKKKIITNSDGIESRRAKWSFIKQKFIKFTEILTMKYSNHVVADSVGIYNYICKTYNIKKEKLSVIEYGAYIVEDCNIDTLYKYGLEIGAYYIVVSRLEPENNLHLILDGFSKSNTKKKLVVIGNLISNSYVNDLLTFKSDKIIFLGGVYDKKELESLRKGAFAYIHGHSVGGTNPSLLEAMGCGNICICHDNIFNREVTNNEQIYFENSNNLKRKIEALESSTLEEQYKKRECGIKRIENYYNWPNIARKYFELIKDVKQKSYE